MIKVLIVEDDPMVAELNSSYMAQLPGFCLAGIVSNGEEAIQFLAQHKVDLILLDIFMPNLDGMELLSHIRSTDRGVDIIMVTASRNSQSIQKALRHGVVDYIVKPFNLQRLQSALLAYKERVQLIRQGQNLDQSDIDQRILLKPDNIAGEMPKGLERETLALIVEQSKNIMDFFTTEEMAQRIGVSRVSLRKYLDYLAKVGVLEMKLTYRSVGRPVHMFRIIAKDYLV